MTDDGFSDETSDHSLDLTPSELGTALLAELRSGRPLIGNELRWGLDDVLTRERADGRLSREIPGWMDGSDLSQTGWEVLFAPDTSWAVRDALEPLLELRKKQAGDRYREEEVDVGINANHYLRIQREVAPGTIDPDKIGYYQLLVGDTASIPFAFQYQLNMNFAVGRLSLETPDDYARYARAVVDAETRGSRRPRRVTFFAVDDDPATKRMKEQLVDVLLDRLPRDGGWDFELIHGSDATKEALGQVLVGGDETPALLFFSGHGLRRKVGMKSQESAQGALVGYSKHLEKRSQAAFRAKNLAPDARLDGMIAFLSSCYSAGTPEESDFSHWREGENGFGMYDDFRPQEMARQDFLARLPQKLLARGAGAVIGHVDQSWSLSYRWSHDGRSQEAYHSLEDTLRELLRGQRLGHAMRALYRRYTAIAADLCEVLKMAEEGSWPDEDSRPFRHLGRLWTACNNARNLIVLGDPAVQMTGSGDGTSTAIAGETLRRLIEAAKREGVSVEELLKDLL